ncbi:MAG: SHOCT domain-containing protein [Polaromonas sp.]|nr:SHOCT domain-containing protein [Polaromonas sp.]
MMWGYDGFGFGGIAMGIGMLLFWGLVIVAIVVLVRGVGGKAEGSKPRLRKKIALDILGERYARGEIDKREFEEKRGDLGGSGSLRRDK